MAKNYMKDSAGRLVDYYSDIQQQIFYKIIDLTKDIGKVKPDDILEWRLKALSRIGALTEETIKIVSNTSGTSIKDIQNVNQKRRTSRCSRY